MEICQHVGIGTMSDNCALDLCFNKQPVKNFEQKDDVLTAMYMVTCSLSQVRGVTTEG